MAINDIIRNLQKEIGNIEGDLSKGLLAAGLFVQGESQRTVPHDTGTLSNSSFTSMGELMGMPAVRVGYTAEYAAFVHEMPQEYNYSKPGTGPKFLEKAVKDNVPTILKIIRDRAVIK